MTPEFTPSKNQQVVIKHSWLDTVFTVEAIHTEDVIDYRYDVFPLKEKGKVDILSEDNHLYQNVNSKYLKPWSMGL